MVKLVNRFLSGCAGNGKQKGADRSLLPTNIKFSQPLGLENQTENILLGLILMSGISLGSVKSVLKP